MRSNELHAQDKVNTTHPTYLLRSLKNKGDLQDPCLGLKFGSRRSIYHQWSERAKLPQNATWVRFLKMYIGVSKLD